MSPLRVQAFSGNIYPSGLGWPDHAEAGVSALRQTCDDVGAAGWGLMALVAVRMLADTL